MLFGGKTMRLSTSVTSLLGLVVAICACSKSASSPAAIVENPTPTPTAAVTIAPLPPIPTTAPVINVPKGFWVGNLSLRLLARFDVFGNRVAEADLQSIAQTGGVTALAFLDPTTIVAILDAGTVAGGEVLVTIDANTGAIKNKSWWQDSTAFAAVESNGIVSNAINNNVLFSGNKTIERLIYNGGGAARVGGTAGGSSSYIPQITAGVCASDKIGNIALLTINNALSLAQLTHNTAHRINILGNLEGSPSCISSYDYAAAGQPTTVDHIPISAVQMPDGKLYVLYQHAVAPKIVSYETDGRTLTNPIVVYEDASVLGATPRGLTKFGETTMLVGNPITGKVFEIFTAGGFTGFFITSTYTSSVGAILTVP